MVKMKKHITITIITRKMDEDNIKIWTKTIQKI